MYCPRCAAPNEDRTKFCRKCGTSLEAVALALVDESPYQKAIQRNRHAEALKRIVQGGGLLTASSLLGLLLRIFSREPDWIIIWLVLVGWVAVWGVLSLAAGIGIMLESRLLPDERPGKLSTSYSPILNGESRSAIDTAPNLTLPPSVTENTTSLLVDPQTTPVRKD